MKAGGRAGHPAANRPLRRDHRGSVAVFTALTAVPLIMFMGMGIELTHWGTVKQRLQRTADAAALAGAQEFLIAKNVANAANAAADLAELNGATGSTTRAWDATNKILSDNQVTAQVVAGVRNSANTAVQVTVTQAVPLMITRMMSSRSSVTLSATGWAEALTSAQPCVLALGAGGVGVSAQGNVTVSLTGCSIRSNSSIATGGAATMSAPAFYAAGSITGQISGALYPNAGTIPDPYATNAPVQNAFGKLSAGSGAAFSNKPNSTSSLTPGTFSTWDIQGTVTLAPGIYYVNGSISLGAQASLSGSGVTIITSGAFNMNGGSKVSLSAATVSNSVNGAIPGIVFAGNSYVTSTFTGNTSPLLTGVVYYPNGTMNFGGTSQGGSSGCLEVIGASVTMFGNSGMAANCAGYGTVSFASVNSTAALVQ
ncbi:pilus assembly protein TadG-related protein [Rhodovastum sp. RN2-1]|uniref:Pilus assembly protein TadG-related protein n=1 Tax=Limobrevibacterium gyesilva TaxID=2991712 RepID=A0AA41YL59_9PROT|nr:pilus assembly protein TadG-related protein [Limobrevibacterium gyesilva]MCW3475434.1 pilus assembly protein TadG-related protein [Limobrevibacterium gyesilva]